MANEIDDDGADDSSADGDEAEIDEDGARVEVTVEFSRQGKAPITASSRGIKIPMGDGDSGWRPQQCSSSQSAVSNSPHWQRVKNAHSSAYYK